MYKLTKAIEDAIQKCLETGAGSVFFDNIEVSADWAEWDECNGFDVVEITIYKYGIIKLTYQIEETKVEIEE